MVAMPVNRQTVDLSAYPDLVVIYLGMRVNALRGLSMLARLGPEIRSVPDSNPDGLLLHESMFYSLRQVGFRQYWRDFESMERWTRSDPHRKWWKQFLKDSGGTGFWHETYFIRGGFEAIYDDMAAPIGMMNFADVRPAKGRMFGARARLGLKGEPPAPVVGEDES